MVSCANGHATVSRRSPIHAENRRPIRHREIYADLDVEGGVRACGAVMTVCVAACAVQDDTRTSRTRAALSYNRRRNCPRSHQGSVTLSARSE
jgi:hypothetical protein